MSLKRLQNNLRETTYTITKRINNANLNKCKCNRERFFNSKYTPSDFIYRTI